MAKTRDKVVIYSVDTGSTLVEIEQIGRRGDNVEIYGKLVGSLSYRMYVPRQSIINAIKMIVRDKQMVFYILSFPFMIVKRKRNKKNP